MRKVHHFAGRTRPGAATGQGRATSTAPKARTLDAAHFERRVQSSTENQSVDIARVKRVVTLAMVLSRYGILNHLKRSGAQLAGCCPIHDGSDPRQFVVHLASNNWFCFGDCNRGGSMLDLVAHKERISIRAAAQLIAQWFAISPSASTARPRAQQRRKTMPTNPSHKVYVVEDRDNAEPGDEQRGFWTRIGSAWPHKDGRGLNVVLSALPVGNRIVLREYTEEDEAREAKSTTGKRKA
jgi:hypothetical protein